MVILKWNQNSSMLEMRMFNADGTEALMCGNAIRCIGAYHFESHPTETELNILTGAGIRRLKQALHGEIEASMGELKILKEDKGSVSEYLGDSDVGDFMMVTDFRCWWQNHYVGVFFVIMMIFAVY